VRPTVHLHRYRVPTFFAPVGETLAEFAVGGANGIIQLLGIHTQFHFTSYQSTESSMNYVPTRFIIPFFFLFLVMLFVAPQIPLSISISRSQGPEPYFLAPKPYFLSR